MPNVATISLRKLQFERRPDKIIVSSPDILTEGFVLFVSSSDERRDGTAVEDRHEESTDHGESH